jgi:hypothetical protein
VHKFTGTFVQYLASLWFLHMTSLLSSYQKIETHSPLERERFRQNLPTEPKLGLLDIVRQYFLDRNSRKNDIIINTKYCKYTFMGKETVNQQVEESKVFISAFKTHSQLRLTRILR